MTSDISRSHSAVTFSMLIAFVVVVVVISSCSNGKSSIIIIINITKLNPETYDHKSVAISALGISDVTYIQALKNLPLESWTLSFPSYSETFRHVRRMT
jgi:hypothetical protein